MTLDEELDESEYMRPEDYDKAATRKWNSRRRRVIRILDSLRIPHKEVDRSEGYEHPSWDGETFRFTLQQNPEDLLHEGCHWLVSDRRHYKNFGLGSAPWGADSKMMFSWERANNEEISACILDIALHYHLRWRWLERAYDVSMRDDEQFKTIAGLMHSVKPVEVAPTMKYLRRDGRLRAWFAERIDRTLAR